LCRWCGQPVRQRWEGNGTGILFNGHFRNDGNSHACTDHAEQTTELATFKNNLGMKASAIAGGDGGIAKAVAVAEKQERFGAKVF
jgi:hypothetical protein